MPLRQINSYYKSIASVEKSEEPSGFGIIMADIARIESALQERKLLKEQENMLRKQREQARELPPAA
jgi:hypothetical protein